MLIVDHRRDFGMMFECLHLMVLVDRTMGKIYRLYAALSLSLKFSSVHTRTLWGIINESLSVHFPLLPLLKYKVLYPLALCMCADSFKINGHVHQVLILPTKRERERAQFLMTKSNAFAHITREDFPSSLSTYNS